MYAKPHPTEAEFQRLRSALVDMAKAMFLANQRLTHPTILVMLFAEREDGYRSYEFRLLDLFYSPPQAEGMTIDRVAPILMARALEAPNVLLTGYMVGQGVPHSPVLHLALGSRDEVRRSLLKFSTENNRCELLPLK